MLNIDYEIFQRSLFSFLKSPKSKIFWQKLSNVVSEKFYTLPPEIRKISIKLKNLYIKFSSYEFKGGFE